MHRLAQIVQNVLARVEDRLAPEQFLDLVVDGLLIKELAAGEPVDVGPQRRDAVLESVCMRDWCASEAARRSSRKTR